MITHSVFSLLCHSSILRRAAVMVTMVALALNRPAIFSEIHDAALMGDLGRVKALLKGKPDLVFSKDNHGDTPLHFAADRGQRDVVELLLASNAKFKNGDTALHFAADKGHKDVAELLLAHKAAVNAKATGGYTPLSFAASNGSNDLVELLRQHGGHE
jgi:ankyrin repeat protein